MGIFNRVFWIFIAFVLSIGCGQETKRHEDFELLSKNCNRIKLENCLASLGGKACYARENCSDSNHTAQRRSYRSLGTAYYPDNSSIEGGFNDRMGKPLRTLQAFLAGKADYVSVAMDARAFAYGTKLRIPELEKKFKRPIEFRVVDTGGAFKGKGTSRIDICVRGASDQYDSTINGMLTLISY